MGPDGLYNMQNKIAKFYLFMLAVLCLLGLIHLTTSFTRFGIVNLVGALVIAAFEAVIFKVKLWKKNKIFAVVLFVEAGFLDYLIVNMDDMYLKAVILIVFVSVVIRLILQFDFMEAYVRRVTIGIIFGVLVVFIIVELFSSYGENYNEIFGITCLALAALLLIIFAFECLADAANEVQEKIFEQRRLADSTKEANESLKVQQEKINKANELLGIQKLKLEAAYQQMHEMAVRDGLTGVYNRGYLNQVIDDMCQEAKDKKFSLAAALFDIDHFKLVNDTYGHLFGDSVIKAVAKIAQEAAQKYDGMVARYGGEEFVIIFKKKDIETCKAIVEEMKQNISDFRLDYNGTPVGFHVSVGVTAYPQTCTEPLELLNHADWAMYYSKENGRNRITIDSDEVRASVRMKSL